MVTTPWRTCVVLLILLVVPACRTDAPPAPLSAPVSTSTPAWPALAERDYWPTDGWRTTAPENFDLTTAFLDQVEPYRSENLPLIDSILVVHRGYVVYESYHGTRTPETRSEVFSVTNSVTSALIGIAIDDGAIRSVDQPALALLPQDITAGIDSQKQQITVEHLLTMRAGVEWNPTSPFSDPPSDSAELRRYLTSPNPLEHALELPLADTPGETFNYASPQAHLLSGIVTEATGTNTAEFAQTHLFAPLGIDAPPWRTDPQGYSFGGHGLALTTREMAKFGYLYLNEGRWSQEQVVPASWVRRSTNVQVRFESRVMEGLRGYGYLWWLPANLGQNAACASGQGGQAVCVIPEYDTVVAMTAQQMGDNRDVGPDVSEMIETVIVPAMR